MIPEIITPNLSTAKKILAVQPHYDDNDIGAGGTLYLLAQKGVEIVYLTVTDDQAGILPQEGGRILTEQEGRAFLEDNQKIAASIIGVQKQIRLNLPDAGDYDYFFLREQIMAHIWNEQPDFLFTVDPWTPYEAHHDHIMTGQACAEAAILYNLPGRDAANTAQHGEYALQGVVFYNTAYPNLIFDVSEGLSAKLNALSAYTAQFSQADLHDLLTQITFLAGYLAREQDFEYGEALKVLAPWMLHGVPLTRDL